jgi:hypothetical protein
LTYRTNAATAEYLRVLIDGMGAAVVGRRLFDVTNGWNGSHPLGKPIIVVTHDAPEGWADAETGRSPSSPTGSRARSRRRRLLSVSGPPRAG